MSASCRDPPGSDSLSVSLKHSAASAEPWGAAGWEAGVSPKGGRLPSAEGHQTEMGRRAVRGWQRLGAQLPLVISYIRTVRMYTHRLLFFLFWVSEISTVLQT